MNANSDAKSFQIDETFLKSVFFLTADNDFIPSKSKVQRTFGVTYTPAVEALEILGERGLIPESNEPEIVRKWKENHIEEILKYREELIEVISNVDPLEAEPVEIKYKNSRFQILVDKGGICLEVYVGGIDGDEFFIPAPKELLSTIGLQLENRPALRRISAYLEERIKLYKTIALLEAEHPTKNKFD